jgi:hypothetical protein
VLVAAFTLGVVHALASRFVNAIRSGLIVLAKCLVSGFLPSAWISSQKCSDGLADLNVSRDEGQDEAAAGSIPTSESALIRMYYWLQVECY